MMGKSVFLVFIEIHQCYIQVSLVIVFYMVGLMIGSYGCGWFGDKIGECLDSTLCFRIRISYTEKDNFQVERKH